MKYLRIEEFVCIVFGGLLLFGFLLFTTISLYLGGMRIERLIPMNADVIGQRNQYESDTDTGSGYIPEILVQYELDHSKFTKWIPPIEGKLFSQDDAMETLTHYPRGSEVMIFVDPKDQSYAVIDTFISEGYYVFSLVLSVFAIAWISATSVVVRKVKIRKSDKNWSADNDITEKNLPSYVEYPISRIGISLTWGLLAVWIFYVGFVLWHYEYFHSGDFPLIMKLACVFVAAGMFAHVGYGIYVCRQKLLARDG